MATNPLVPEITDEITGTTAPVVCRVLGAWQNGEARPQFLLMGDQAATIKTPVGSYRADGDKLYWMFHRGLPSGTFARLAVEYLRNYRKTDAARYDEPERLDKALLVVINALTERFLDADNNHETDPARS